MTEPQLAAFSIAIVASFAWIIGMRGRSRAIRVLGVCVLMGAWVGVRWMGTF